MYNFNKYQSCDSESINYKGKWISLIFLPHGFQQINSFQVRGNMFHRPEISINSAKEQEHGDVGG
jgi:hypothetical protein